MSAMVTTVESSHHHECCSCLLPVAGPDLVTLQCNHYFCIECVNHLARQHNRRWCLPCQKLGCGSRFAVPLVPEVQCTPRPTVYQQCVTDRYSAAIEKLGVLEVGSKIRGIALLENTLYVASSEKFLLKYTVEGEDLSHDSLGTCLADMKWARGLAVSRKYNTVYVVDWSRLFGGTLWITRTGSNSVSKIEFGVQPFGVSSLEAASGSVDESVKIFVTCATPGVGNQSILLFHDDGERVYQFATLQLPSDFEIPRHAVNASRESVDEYVVCHGWTRFKNHRVSVVRRVTGSDVVLQETASIGTRGGRGQQQLRRPVSLCVDEDGMILVADYYNHRILLLTPRLQLVRHLVTKQEHGIEYPRHMCIDVERGLLFVGLYDGKVCVFRVRDRGSRS